MTASMGPSGAWIRGCGSPANTSRRRPGPWILWKTLRAKGAPRFPQVPQPLLLARRGQSHRKKKEKKKDNGHNQMCLLTRHPHKRGGPPRPPAAVPAPPSRHNHHGRGRCPAPTLTKNTHRRSAVGEGHPSRAPLAKPDGARRGFTKEETEPGRNVDLLDVTPRVLLPRQIAWGLGDGIVSPQR